MKALITGVTGQDGPYLAQLLLEKGYSVIGTSRNANYNSNGLKFLGIENDVEVICTSLLDSGKMVEILKNHRPDEVYNLAAQSSVGVSFQIPHETLNFNIDSVLNILEAIVKTDGAIKFYQASSSEMFGNINQLPVKEDGYFHPSSPYGISKAAAHWLAVNYREGYNIFSSCGILFNHESALRGDNYVTSKIIQGALKIKSGSRYKLKLGNLSIYRDWGYAPKYVEAMWLILQQRTPNDYIICSNNVMSLEEFVNLVFSHLDLNYKDHIEIDPSLYRAVDLERMHGDNSKAKRDLNWVYDHSNEDLVELLIQDYRNYNQWRETQK